MKEISTKGQKTLVGLRISRAVELGLAWLLVGFGEKIAKIWGFFKLFGLRFGGPTTPFLGVLAFAMQSGNLLRSATG